MSSSESNTMSALTPREIDVMLEIRSGVTRNASIAKRLGVTPRTVTDHLQKIYDKLGVGFDEDFDNQKLNSLLICIQERIIPPFG